ncbi:hypothetical protein LDO26_04260 [Luteimonas sp. BDR2-5]|uniref:hypothetical protein n=1 Tax=Proluteimonas luteida TaxID=2878685 RepID=UPI001E2E0039|nr:hypothetical protein [Luteimonas sp. BDR2-5]MCD9027428.1 hypothetical protein [Luteimonas sp. BDR2-5]
MSALADLAVRRTLLVVSACGFLLFGGLWLLSMVRPDMVESTARTLLVKEVEHRVGERIGALSDSAVAGLARRVAGEHAAEAERLRRLSETLPARVATVVDAMADRDCACRAELAERVRGGIGLHLQRIAGLEARLDALIRDAYAHTAARLLREFRIFTGANALVFLVLGMVAWRRRGAALQLLVPAVVLVGAGAVSAGFYLFNQDWLRTIVFDDYVGYGYFAWLGVLVALFADILVNRARVTTRIVNAVLQALGSAASAVPC